VLHGLFAVSLGPLFGLAALLVLPCEVLVVDGFGGLSALLLFLVGGLLDVVLAAWLAL
jgi:hypothetical protein